MSENAACDRRGWLIHAGRALLLVGIVLLLRAHHRKILARDATLAAAPPLERVQRLLPNATALNASDAAWDVLDVDGKSLGIAMQTSPASDGILGFSGPSNLLIVFDPRGKIVGLDVLSSRDTREHVEQVVQDRKFLRSFDGLTAEEAVARSKVDAVSGATLTSFAMIEGIQRRLGGRPASLKFPDAIELKDVLSLFPKAKAVEKDAGDTQVIRVFGDARAPLGWALRTSPNADGIVGYQGPTDALVGFDAQGKVIGVALAKSYDNDPYVRYVREDEPFLAVFNDQTAEQLGKMNLKDAGVEGVSGATMTSMAVAEGVVRASAAKHVRDTAPPPRTWWESIALADVGSGVVIVMGLVVGLTNLRGVGWLRIAYQVVAFGYLGLVNGVLLSQAQLIGWAQAGVPWGAWSLILLTVAALAIPLGSKRNVYCTHLCPHGALQQLALRVAKPRRTLAAKIRTIALGLPMALLATCLAIAMTGAPISLVNLEPFDAYVVRVAGGATLAIAVVGAVASFFVPMAYCRYGCPTGALLEYVRRSARDGEFQARDAVAAAMFLFAMAMWFYG